VCAYRQSFLCSWRSPHSHVGRASRGRRDLFYLCICAFRFRIEAPVELKRHDIDFDRKVLNVRRSAWCGQVQTVKSKSSRAPLPPVALAEILRQCLTAWRPNPAKLLFANRLGRPYNANKVVQKGLWPILKDLRIEHCGLHAFAIVLPAHSENLGGCAFESDLCCTPHF